MQNGGKREGSGRKKGVPNKASAERQARVRETGETPLDVMIWLMHFFMKEGRREFAKGPPASRAKVFDAFGRAGQHAKDAAAYVHPRLSAAKQRQTFDPSCLTDDELRELDRLFEKVARARSPELREDKGEDSDTHH